MKEAEKIINHCEAWSKEDQKHRTAVAIMADRTDGNVYIHFAGTSRDIAKLVNTLMNEDAEFGHDIYAAACVYAHKHIEEAERNKINAVSSAIAEERKEQKGGNNEQKNDDVRSVRQAEDTI